MDFPLKGKGDPASQDTDADDLFIEDMPELGNLATVIPPATLNAMVSEALEGYELDVGSRGEWERVVRAAIELVRNKRSPKTFPWDGAANAKYPLMTSAINGFAARAFPSIVKQGQVVKGATYGGDREGKKASRSKRVAEHMTYQLVEENDHWETDMDKLLHQLPLAGTAFKKVYWDSENQAPGIDFIPALDLVVNQATTSLKECPRVTQKCRKYPHEIRQNVRKGIYSEGITDHLEDNEDRHADRVILEIHTRFDLDEDGYDEPYILTIDEKTRECLRLQANFNAEDVQRDETGEVVQVKGLEYFIDFHFIPDPEGNFYSLGFAMLLDTPQEIVNSLLNQLLDAGVLANTPMTFLGGGLGKAFKKSELTFSPGQMRSVPVMGDDLRKQIVTHTFPEPSATLYQLMEFMLNSGKEIGMIADVLSGNAPAQEAAAKTLARIDQALQPFNSVYERVFRGLKKEFKFVSTLNAQFLPAEKYIKFIDPEPEQDPQTGQPIPVDPQAFFRADYEQGDCDIVPISSPGQVTRMQRMAAADALKEYLGEPEVNRFEILKRIFEAMEVDDVAAVLTPPQPDPFAEEMKQADLQEKQAKGARELGQALKALADASRPTKIEGIDSVFEPDPMKLAAVLQILQGDAPMEEAPESSAGRTLPKEEQPTPAGGAS